MTEIKELIMFVSFQGKQFIKSFERGPNGGAALQPYDAHDGFKTIGWGHKIIKGEQFTQITPTQADELFEKDLSRKSLLIIQKYVRVPLSQQQLDALASYVFNSGSLAHTRLLFYLNNKDYIKAVSEMDIQTVSIYKNGEVVGHKTLQGLVKRRKAEHDIWNFGKYVNH